MKTERKQIPKRSKVIPLTSLPMPTNFQITTLDLSSNQIHHMENLNKLKSLTYLNLSHNRISKIQDIFGLDKLEIVILNNNLIEYIPKEMGNMNSLKVVDIRNNRILFVHAISSLENKELKQFRVEGNRVTKRPKFQQTMERILEKKTRAKDEILEVEYLTTEGTIQNTYKETQTIPMTTSIQLIGTFRSMTEVESKLEPEEVVDQQFEAILQAKDQQLNDKKNLIVDKYNEILSYSSKVDKMIERDRPYLQSEQQIVKLVGKFILDTNSVCKNIIQKTTIEVQKILQSFQSYSYLQNTTILQILYQNQLQHHSLLKGILMTDKNNQFPNSIEKIKQYSAFYNSLRGEINQIDSLISSYTQEFNYLYQIIELKTVLEEQIYTTPIESKQQKITSLESQILISNEINQELIKQNNVFLQTIDKLEEKIKSQEKQIEQLKQRWVKLEQVREEGNIMLEKVMEKQHGIVGMMQQKLTGDFFQALILNQAQTIEMLVEGNKSIKDKIYIQEIDKYKMDNEYLLTMIETGKKKIQRNHDHSAESNLLSDKPLRCRTELPSINPINYFSKSINLLSKGIISQPSTQRGQTYMQTYRDDKVRRKSHSHNSTGKKIIFDRDQIQQSETYRQYKKYYLRNSIIDLLIDKKMHAKTKQRYDSKELRLRKFKQMSGKRILRQK